MFASQVRGLLKGVETGVGEGVGVPVGLAVGVGVGVGVGVAVGVAVGDGVGVGTGQPETGFWACVLYEFPSKLPGFAASAGEIMEAVAFEAKATQRPFWLITGRLFTISIRILSCAVDPNVFFSTLLVSVIWKVRRCA